MSEKNRKNFHFQEMDWFISFPNAGNEGRKYLYYTVEFADRKNNKDGKQVCLVELMDDPNFEACFPHTVGYFREPVDKKSNSGFAYLEIRIVNSIEDFFKFLNDLDL